MIRVVVPRQAMSIEGRAAAGRAFVDASISGGGQSAAASIRISPKSGCFLDDDSPFPHRTGTCHRTDPFGNAVARHIARRSRGLP